MQKLSLGLMAVSSICLVACNSNPVQGGDVAKAASQLVSGNQNSYQNTNNTSATTDTSNTSTTDTSSASSTNDTSNTSSANDTSNTSTTNDTSNTSTTDTSSTSTTNDLPAAQSIMQSKTINAQGLQNNVREDLKELAKEVAEEVVLRGVANYNMTITSDGKSYQNAQNMDLKDLGAGFKVVNTKETATAQTNVGDFKVIREGQTYLYQQNYSLIGHVMPSKVSVVGKGSLPDDENDENSVFVESVFVKGSPTTTLPTAGKATYNGEAFGVDDSDKKLHRGSLTYTVDFEKKTGSGSINNPRYNITLAQGKIDRISYNNEIDGTIISGYGIKGGASLGGETGDYELGFFGPNAEEIVGNAEIGESNIGFGGKR